MVTPELDDDRATRRRHRLLKGTAALAVGVTCALPMTMGSAGAAPITPAVNATVTVNGFSVGVVPTLNSVIGSVKKLVGTGLLDNTLWGDSTVDQAAQGADGKNQPIKDAGSLYTIENAIGARTVWMKKDASGKQITGQGVSVALLDSGTAQVAGLNAPGKVTYGPDLSIESNGSLTDVDTFGHGTHLGGIIAAHDSATLTPTTIPTLSASTQLGVAPDANLLSIKLATTDGSTDVSQIIAALNWVTEHQTNPDGTKIRVVNLSFGTNSLQSYQVDPLVAAAENAWKHGLVVVVSGGNEGAAAGRLTDPAIDPYVIAVGASDGGTTPLGWATPTVASFSSSGNVTRHVDLLAPGKSIASLRDPGSYVDVNHSEGLVAGDSTGRLFRGSGTSQAAAVTSGAVALLLQAYPTLTPDQVKAALVSTATPVAASAIYAGSGELNVPAALAKAATYVTRPAGLSALLPIPATLGTVQYYPVATGQGSLDAARGGYALVDSDGNPLEGEVDVLGNAWKPAAWWAASTAGSTWNAGSWMGAVWTGPGWMPTVSGQSARWSSARWSSARWSSAGWDSARWSSARWSSARWSSARWSSAGWDSARWSGAQWP